MAGLFDHLGLERAIVGGGSMGAGTSVTFALAHPQRVEKLVLLAPPPLAETIGTAQQVFGGLATLIGKLGVAQATDLVMKLEPYASLKDTDPAQYELTREWLATLAPRSTVFAIRGLLNGPALAADRFAKITAPALIVAHDGDPIHPRSSAERLHGAIAGSQLVTAPDMTYYRERPSELVDTVVEFLRGDSAAK
jgi:pimeloyl-ACP methyl ester carboxylesterase